LGSEAKLDWPLSLRHFREIVGLTTLSAAKALCDGDRVDQGRIFAKVS
jgi:hypothetical protein